MTIAIACCIQRLTSKSLSIALAVALISILHCGIDASASAQTTALPDFAPVVDQAKVLSPDERKLLTSRIDRFRQERGTEFGILLIRTLGAESLEAYGNIVANHWRLGRHGIGDGIVILVVVDDRQARVEVSRALEGAVPDAVAKRILAEVMRPYFARRDFHGGLDAGLTALFRQVGAEGLPVPTDLVDTAARHQYIGKAISTAIGAIMLLLPGWLFFGFAGRWSRFLVLPFSLFLAYLLGAIAFALCKAMGYGSAGMIAAGFIFFAASIFSTLRMFRLALSTPPSLASYVALRAEKARRKSLATSNRTRTRVHDGDDAQRRWRQENDDDDSRSSFSTDSTSSGSSSSSSSGSSSGGGSYGGGGASDRW